MQLQGKGGVRHLAMLSMMSAVAIICGYIEVLIPFSFGIPGVKLGLCNFVTVLILYLAKDSRLSFCRRVLDAAIVLLIRIVVISLLFTNVYALLYSLAGGLFSLFVMAVCSRFSVIGATGCSVLGGISHNLAQLMIAALIVNELKLVYYLPVLLLSGTVTGFLTGILSDLLISRRGVRKIYDRFFEG